MMAGNAADKIGGNNMMYEVDLRDRKTGNSIECVLSTENHDEAWDFAREWNKNQLSDYDEDVSYDSYIDGTEGLVADVYEILGNAAHGVGSFPSE